MKWINAEQQVTVTIYDEEHEEYLDRTMSVEETLDTYTNEGCPTIYSNPEQPRWIPVSERLPKDLEPVNVTWVNHNPGSYYADIKDKPFTATGVYFNGQWYWWSTLCTDILAEYSHNYDDIVADDVEITAWQPLPKPYEPQVDKEQEDGNDD